MKEILLVVLSGPSGSGKSTAMNALEDIGFFCVDNLPVILLPKFLELISQSEEIGKAATVIDAREGEFLKDLSSTLEEIRALGYKEEILYLEASDEALGRRFSETRRRHPLSEAGSPLEGIARERELLHELREQADKLIDTTDFNVHDLKREVTEFFSYTRGAGKLSLSILSFSYRHGIPSDADLVIDVRFLPNPFFIESLKSLTGRDSEVVEYLSERSEVKDFLRRTEEYLGYLLPRYLDEGKSYITVGIGCTGGRHRSVAIAEALSEPLSSDIIDVRVKHRDIDKN